MILYILERKEFIVNSKGTSRENIQVAFDFGSKNDKITIAQSAWLELSELEVVNKCAVHGTDVSDRDNVALNIKRYLRMVARHHRAVEPSIVHRCMQSLARALGCSANLYSTEVGMENEGSFRQRGFVVESFESDSGYCTISNLVGGGYGTIDVVGDGGVRQR